MSWSTDNHRNWNQDFKKVRRYIYYKANTFAWSKPYPDSIESIDTGLEGRFKYSPRFKKSEADLFIELTGRRAKDYKIAEATTKTKHIPRKTVWHHVWNEINGEYEMQLVDYNIHKSTYSHAGGCKLWLLQHPNSKKYARKERGQSNIEISASEYFISQNIKLEPVYNIRYRRNYCLNYGTANLSSDYRDVVLDYKFPETEVHSFIRKYALNDGRNLRIKEWGLDPYGNIIYQDGRGCLYFCDHEEGSLTPLNIREVHDK